ncbi:DNA polymerase II large subunit [Candidatus Woesearchaeota archaeon]|nr:DNA polymerase II large subunit [Candidatus Woesearchaeota archaeon]
MQCSPSMQEYFIALQKNVEVAYTLALQAREQCLDPEHCVDIPLAGNMAERVEGLIGSVAPQLIGSGLKERIQKLEQAHGALSWRVALFIAEEVAREKFCIFPSRKDALEVGIRVGFAYHTLGIVSAPLEGFTELQIKKRKDGKEYLAGMYAGPVRGAGGTGAAFSVLILDYLRVKFGYEKYDPSEEEVERFVAEIYDYHERITNLQYLPSEEEIRFLAQHLPVEVDGDPTEDIEVSRHKDLPRVATNMIRGGVCLVLAEGLAQKAPKLWLRLQKWGKEFGLEWGFLQEFLALQKQMKAREKDVTKDRLAPNYTYIKDLVAGRPVLTHPMRHGGFRLRYGRSRLSGFSSAAIHPATQAVLHKYIATGTQLKVERPGKATALTVCDALDGPIVKLQNGSVVKVNKEAEVKQLGEIQEILFLGDILFSYGDFAVNGHPLVPAGYCEEWYVQEFEKATVEMFGTLDLEKLSALLQISVEHLSLFLKEPFRYKFSAAASITVAEKLNIPLHPMFTYYWNCITPEQLLALLQWLKRGQVQRNGEIEKIILPLAAEKRYLELIGLPHLVSANEYVVIEQNHALALLYTVNCHTAFDVDAALAKLQDKPWNTSLEMVQGLCPAKLWDTCGTFIGARMGRPEKAKMRKLKGSPQVLFPVGEEGGKTRSIQVSLGVGKVTADFPLYQCASCTTDTIYAVCERCRGKTKRVYLCNLCGYQETERCKIHGKNKAYRNRSIDVQHYLRASLSHLGLSTYPDLIKGVKGTSNKEHIPEHLAKGILRAKHNLYVNKDGTTRYDMTELPLTHFKPKEIKVRVETLRVLGYTYDIHGKPLEDAEQILELKPQDIILPGGKDTLDEAADQVLFRIGNFVDELLERFYGLTPFYRFKAPEALIGHLVIGLAPHISAGMVGRIIGFSEIQGVLAHPLWHAALRRDCDGDEACVMLLLDALLNFSRKYLPDKRGGRTMDAPLVLTTRLIPAEVDDMVHGLDIAWRYPLALYEAALQYKMPVEVEVEQLKKRLGKEGQYEGMGFTHHVSSINAGITCSAYKTLPSMEDKLKGQMELAEKIRAVDAADVAALVIEKHFLRDTKGNLRKFGTQQFRCSKCNEKFRRPPLIGKCTKCGGKLQFTVSEGGIIKYLEPSISLAKKYNVSPYLMQTLELTKRRIEGVFGKASEKQAGLGAWFG